MGDERREESMLQRYGDLIARLAIVKVSELRPDPSAVEQEMEEAASRAAPALERLAMLERLHGYRRRLIEATEGQDMVLRRWADQELQGPVEARWNSLRADWDALLEEHGDDLERLRMLNALRSPDGPLVAWR